MPPKTAPKNPLPRTDAAMKTNLKRIFGGTTETSVNSATMNAIWKRMGNPPIRDVHKVLWENPATKLEIKSLAVRGIDWVNAITPDIMADPVGFLKFLNKHPTVEREKSLPEDVVIALEQAGFAEIDSLTNRSNVTDFADTLAGISSDKMSSSELKRLIPKYESLLTKQYLKGDITEEAYKKAISQLDAKTPFMASMEPDGAVRKYAEIQASAPLGRIRRERLAG
jgi:hypothetical protein